MIFLLFLINKTKCFLYFGMTNEPKKKLHFEPAGAMGSESYLKSTLLFCQDNCYCCEKAKEASSAFIIVEGFLF
jgi:hypothetical protein